MKKTDKSVFSTGSIPKTILRMAWPMIAAEFVHVLYSIVDRIFIGHMPGDGTIALTGIGVAFPIITFISAFASFVSFGGAPLFSIARGEGNNDRAKDILESCFAFCVVAGLILSITTFSLAPKLLTLLGGDEDSLPYALNYFRIYALGSICVLISLGMNSFVNSQGFASIGMMTVVIGAVLNLVLDPLLIFKFNMGVKGAAIATVISQTVSALWVVIFLCGNKPPVNISSFKLNFSILADVTRLGVAGWIFKFTNSVTQAIVNVAIGLYAGVSGGLYIGVFSIINSLREVNSIPSSGLMGACGPVISYNFGAKLFNRVDKAISFTLLFAFITNFIIWILFLSFPSVFASLFSSDKELIQIATHGIRIYFGAFFCMAFHLLGQQVFAAMNYPRFALTFSLLRKVVLVSVLTLLLPRIGFGVDGIFYAEMFSQIIGSAATFTSFYFLIWKRVKKLAHGENSILPRH